MSYYVAIDKQLEGAHVAVVEATFRGARLVTLDTVLHEEGEEEKTFWARVRAVLPTHVDTVCFLMQPSYTSTRVLSFPFADLRKVDMALEFELENQIPYDIENIVSSYQVVSKTETTLDALVAYAPKVYIEQQIAALKEALLEPRTMVLYGVSLAECVPVEKRFRGVLWIGEKNSCFTLVREGVAYYTRTFRTDVAKTGPYGVCTGVVSALKTLPSGWSPEDITVLYEKDAIEGFAEACADFLGCPVVQPALKECLQGVEYENLSVNGSYVPVLSAVLAMLRKTRLVPMDFRKGAYAYQGDFHVYRESAFRVGVGLSVVLVLAFLGACVKYWAALSEEEEVNKAFCGVTKKVVGREICDSTAALATLKQSPGLSEGVYIPAYSATAMFEMMSKKIGTEIDVKFEELDMRVGGHEGEVEERVSGKGEAASFETTEKLAAVLKQDPCVEDVDVSKQRKSKNAGRVEFNILVKLKCPPGVVPGGSSENAPNNVAQPFEMME
jgi:hypothetical protein